jgi:hypothetical protein
MFKLSDTEIARLKACDHVVVKEPEFDQGAIRALLRDKHCPVEAIPMLLALVDKETGFEIPYTTATKRNPECSMRRRYAKPKDKQVRRLHTACSGSQLALTIFFCFRLASKLCQKL